MNEVYIDAQMSKAEAAVARKNARRQYKEESLRGTRLNMESIVIWVASESGVINNALFKTVYCQVGR